MEKWINKKGIKMIIPNFKNTNEALKYGLLNKGNTFLINVLRIQRKFYLFMTKFLHLIGRESDAFYLACGQCQFVRECLEVMDKN